MSASHPESLPRSSPGENPAPRPFTLHGWTDPAVIGVALVALAAGFGQFGLTATLGDVSRHFP
ncbi:MAG TPA: hypothetical protein VMQ59_08750, partial [Acidimicrobiales bacterium]|nr:hypothetical protein [Acidimicrobiales bacterium]